MADLDDTLPYTQDPFGLNPFGICGAQDGPYWVGIPVEDDPDSYNKKRFIKSGETLAPDPALFVGFSSGNREVNEFSKAQIIGKMPFGGLKTDGGTISFQPAKTVPGITFKGQPALSKDAAIPVSAPLFRNAVSNADSSVQDWTFSGIGFCTDVPPQGGFPTLATIPPDIQDFEFQRKGFPLRGIINLRNAVPNQHCPIPPPVCKSQIVGTAFPDPGGTIPPFWVRPPIYVGAFVGNTTWRIIQKAPSVGCPSGMCIEFSGTVDLFDNHLDGWPGGYVLIVAVDAGDPHVEISCNNTCWPPDEAVKTGVYDC